MRAGVPGAGERLRVLCGFAVAKEQHPDVQGAATSSDFVRIKEAFEASASARGCNWLAVRVALAVTWAMRYGAADTL